MNAIGADGDADGDADGAAELKTEFYNSLT